MDGICFQAKVDAHIGRQKQSTPGHYINSSGEEKVLTRNEYSVIEPEHADRCAGTPAIVVEGPGRRGEVVQVCTEADCDVHGRVDHRAEREAEAREREAEWKQRQAARERNLENNRQLLDATLERIPKSFVRADYEMLVLAMIKRLDYDELAVACERYGIDADQEREPDYANVALAEKARQLTERQLTRMLVELALLPSGLSDEELEPTDLLVVTSARYSEIAASARRTRAKSRHADPHPVCESNQGQSGKTAKSGAVRSGRTVGPDLCTSSSGLFEPCRVGCVGSFMPDGGCSTDTLGVPKMCPRYAFLPLLPSLPQCRISNLLIPKGPAKNKSPSPHHLSY